MNRKLPVRGLFITGTGTQVGKTYVGSLIVKSLRQKGYRVGVYKPVASGCKVRIGEVVSNDAECLWNAAGQPLTLDQVCPQRFLAPLAPHRAAKLEGRQVDARLLREGLAVWTEVCDLVIVEGIGGLMTPLTDDEYVADLSDEFGYPLVIVTPNILGTINATLQTLITASCFREGLPVAGVVLNDVGDVGQDPSAEFNRLELEARSLAPILTRVPFAATELPPEIDWMDLTRPRPT